MRNCVNSLECADLSALWPYAETEISATDLQREDRYEKRSKIKNFLGFSYSESGSVFIRVNLWLIDLSRLLTAPA
jgi:nitric oxide synthase oxygenase domain/subunit